MFLPVSSYTCSSVDCPPRSPAFFERLEQPSGELRRPPLARGEFLQAARRLPQPVLQRDAPLMPFLARHVDGPAARAGVGIGVGAHGGREALDKGAERRQPTEQVVLVLRVDQPGERGPRRTGAGE